MAGGAEMEMEMEMGRLPVEEPVYVRVRPLRDRAWSLVRVDAGHDLTQRVAWGGHWPVSYRDGMYWLLVSGPPRLAVRAVVHAIRAYLGITGQVRWQLTVYPQAWLGEEDL